eukprot:scaffold4599_cov219-Amphora_coffeaeformis.AAC.1
MSAPSSLALDHDGQRRNHLEALALLHANAVNLAMEGEYGLAAPLFRDVCQGLQTRSPDLEEDFEEVNHMNLAQGRTANVLRVVSMDLANLPHVYSMDGSRLARPLAVLIPQDRYNQGLATHDIALFAVTALYNIGLCYHVLSFTTIHASSTSLFHQRAQYVYEIAHQSLGSMQRPGEANGATVGLVICNNLAALHADSGNRESLSRCLGAIQGYLHDIDASTMDSTWIHSNIFDWHLFQDRHAAVA